MGHQVWRLIHEKSEGEIGPQDRQVRVARQSFLVPYLTTRLNLLLTHTLTLLP
jgi:hypothetical protein